MSKAFLRESDFADVTDPPVPATVLPRGAKNYLTAEGAEQLRDELSRLTVIDRPPLAANPSDSDARRQLHVIDARIRYLQQSLRTAEIVTFDHGPQDVVRFGSTVTVRDQEGGEARYRLVGVDETDLGSDRISWQSPLAKSLLNARVGQHVTLKTPVGTRELEIVAIAA